MGLIKSTIKLFLVLMGVALFESRTYYRSRKMAMIRRLENCPNETDLPISLRNYTFRKSGAVTIANGWSYVRSNEEKLSAMQIHVERCTDKGNGDSCEYYANWFTDQPCIFIQHFPNAKSLMPPEQNLSCVFVQGAHQVKNVRLKDEMVSPLLKDVGNAGLWKFRIKGTNSNRETPIFCIESDLRIVTVKVPIESSPIL